MSKLVSKDVIRKASMVASVVQVRLAEDVIKKVTVVETMLGVINTASILNKEGLDECIVHLQSGQPIDREWLLEMIHVSYDQVQLASVSNALTEMAGFGMVDVATSVVHARIRNLHLPMAWAVYGQKDIGQLDRLLVEILVSLDSLFGSQLTNVIVGQSRRARD